MLRCDAPRNCAVTFSFFIVGRCCHRIFQRDVLSDLLYAGDLVLLSETIEGLRNMFLE